MDYENFVLLTPGPPRKVNFNVRSGSPISSALHIVHVTHDNNYNV